MAQKAHQDIPDEMEIPVYQDTPVTTVHRVNQERKAPPDLQDKPDHEVLKAHKAFKVCRDPKDLSEQLDQEVIFLTILQN